MCGEVNASATCPPQVLPECVFVFAPRHVLRLSYSNWKVSAGRLPYANRMIGRHEPNSHPHAGRGTSKEE